MVVCDDNKAIVTSWTAIDLINVYRGQVAVYKHVEYKRLLRDSAVGLVEFGGVYAIEP